MENMREVEGNVCAHCKNDFHLPETDLQQPLAVLDIEVQNKVVITHP